ncbi:MAG: hypothetical protein ACRC2H_12675 [Silanimonas sp.]
MNRRLIGLSAFVALMLAGCASTGGTASGSASLSVDERAAPSGVDLAYVERRNRIARERGFIIRWVDPPRYRPPKDKPDDVEPSRPR